MILGRSTSAACPRTAACSSVSVPAVASPGTKGVASAIPSASTASRRLGGEVGAALVFTRAGPNPQRGVATNPLRRALYLGRYL